MLKLSILPAAVILLGTILPVAAQTETIPAKLQRDLRTSAQGAVVSLHGLDVASCPRISTSQTFIGGKLIFSDSPESPAGPGILYMDTNLAPTDPSTPNRVFVYHVNASASAKMKFSILIKNNGKFAAALTVRRTGIAGPSANYMVVGENALYRWLTNSAVISRPVRPGQTARLDASFDSINVGPGDLLNGIWDYTFDQPHAIIICSLRPKDDPLTAAPSLRVLARDSHDRGTFEHCNKMCVTTAGTRAVQWFPIGGRGDIYVAGYDNSVFPPVPAVNDGNYGVLYTIKLNVTSPPGALALLINPQGGPWCGAIDAAPGLLPGGAFVIPSNGKAISDSSSAAVGGEYFTRGRQNVSFQFMPAGASSFPVYITTARFSRDR